MACGGYPWQLVQVLTVEQAIAAGAVLFISCTGMPNTITVEQLLLMSHSSIVCSIHGVENEIALTELRKTPGVLTEEWEGSIHR